MFASDRASYNTSDFASTFAGRSTFASTVASCSTSAFTSYGSSSISYISGDSTSYYASDFASDASNKKWIISQLLEAGKSMVPATERLEALKMEKDYHIKTFGGLWRVTPPL
jgi:hypothetical protein